MDAHIAIYGNKKLSRVFCEACKGYSFVIDGKVVCCGTPTSSLPEYSKRMACPENKRHGPSRAVKVKLLEEFDHCCAYCERKFGSFVWKNNKKINLRIHWDHAVPFSYSQDNSAENFLPACQICNTAKSDRIFRDLEEARLYVCLREAQTSSDTLMPSV